MDYLQNRGMAQEDEASLGVRSMNGLKGRQAKDKIAYGALMDNKNRFHGFPIRTSLSSEAKPVVIAGKLFLGVLGSD